MTRSENTFLKTTSDGRHWQIEVFGPGKILATDIMSPTGYHEWISFERAGVRFGAADLMPVYGSRPAD